MMNRINELDPWKWLDPPDNRNPKYIEKANELFNALDNCSTLASALKDITSNRKTVEIKSLIDMAMVLVEEEL